MASGNASRSKTKTLFCNSSAVSPSKTSHAFWSKIGPWSYWLSTKCTVQPVILTPKSIAAWCTRNPYMPCPQNEGMSEGWMLITRFSKSGGMRTCWRYPPITTSLAPLSRIGAKTCSECSCGDWLLRFGTTSDGIPASCANTSPPASERELMTSRKSTVTGRGSAGRSSF